MTRAALLVLLILSFVVGCGDEPSSGGDVQERIVSYLGYDLHCIHFKGSGHGKWSGVSCDFERFWRENAS